MKNVPTEQYLRLAKELTGSTDIDVLIESALKLARSMNVGDAVSYHSMYNIEEFAKTCKIIHPVKGMIGFNPYDYQTKLLKELKEPGSIIVNTSRQMGMSTVLGIYSLHEAITKPNQTIVLIAPKFASALDHMERIRYMVEHSTNALWPSVTVFNKAEIQFSNGSRIFARAATGNSTRGISINTLISVDTAYYSFSKESEIWDSWIPTIALGGKLIMASTPNIPKGLFYKVWSSDNRYRKVSYPWNCHPDRDANWADLTKQYVGLENFKREYECEFISPEDGPTSPNADQ